MYSDKAKQFLEANKAQIGDIIKYAKDDFEVSGILIPNTSCGDDNCLVLKMSSGYNAGFSIDEAKINVISKNEFNFSGGEKKMSKTISGSGSNHISLISTGGTISSRVDYKTGAVDTTLSAVEILQLYPSLKKFEPIEVNSFLNILSEDMTPKHWEEISAEVKSSVDDGAAGVVISHGTDTLGYSSAALSYALQGVGVPIVFTGAQRSPDRASSDAPQNIFCSMAVARSRMAGVYVCMHASTNDDYNYLHSGVRARKCHTSGRWAFRSIGAKPLAKVDGKTGDIKAISDSAYSAKSSIEFKNKFSENVHIAWAYPGIKSSEVKRWSEFDGVVIAGTGLGHITNDVHKEISDLISSDVLVAMAPQTLHGRVMLETYATGRKLEDMGVIGNGFDWLCETAYVKMCWALGQTKNVNKAKELLQTPIAGDISEYSAVDLEE